MAVYNGERFLAEQVESVLAQLRGGDELIVIDDSSSDRSILEGIASPCVKFFSNVTNRGVRETFERGLALARSEIVFLSDQDDVWIPGKLEAFVEVFAADPRVMVVVSDAQVIDGDGRVSATSFMAGRGGFRGGLVATLWRNRYLGCAMAIRRRLLNMALPIPGAAPQHDMWLGAMGAIFGRVVYLPVPYLRYRRHGANASPAGGQPLRRLIAWRLSMLIAVVGRVLSVGLRQLIRGPG